MVALELEGVLALLGVVPLLNVAVALTQVHGHLPDVERLLLRIHEVAGEGLKLGEPDVLRVLAPPQDLSQVVSSAEWQETQGQVFHIDSLVHGVLGQGHQGPVSSGDGNDESSVALHFKACAKGALRSNFVLFCLLILYLLQLLDFFESFYLLLLNSEVD